MKYQKLDKNHKYLGHFRGCLKEGHNTNEMPGDESVLSRIKAGTVAPKPKEEKKPETKQPPAGVVRG